MKRNRWEDSNFTKVFDQNSTIFKDLMSLDKVIVIPRYQRPFVWKKKNFKKMLEIIDSDSLENKKLFLGMIMTFLDSREPNTLEVIDGQQRITTLYLFNLVLLVKFQLIRNKINKELKSLSEINDLNNEQLITKTVLETNQLKEIDSVVRKITNILLNDDDKAKLRYQSDSESNEALNYVIEESIGYLVRGDSSETSFTTFIKNISKNHKLKKHKIFKDLNDMSKILDDFIEDDEKADRFEDEIYSSLEPLKYLYKYINDEIAFTKIDISDLSTAMEIFERVNTTGEKLTTLDLIFNGIFKNIHKHSKTNEDDFEAQISRIEKIRNKNDENIISKSLPNILNCYNIGKQTTEKKSYDEVIKHYSGLNSISSYEKVKRIINDLEEIYKVNERMAKKDLYPPKLNMVYDFARLFDFKMIYSQLIAKCMYWESKSEEQIELIQKMFVDLLIVQLTQISLSRKDTKLFIPIIDSLAKIKHDSSVEAYNEAINSMKLCNIFIETKEWLASGSTDEKVGQFNRNAKQNKTLLKFYYVLGEYKSGKLDEMYGVSSAKKVDINWDILEIEHILPQNYSNWILDGYWSKNIEKIDESMELLGNKLIITGKLNKDLSNGKFSVKKEKYNFKESTGNDIDGQINILNNSFMKSDLISESEDWTDQEINERNRFIVKTYIEMLREIFSN